MAPRAIVLGLVEHQGRVLLEVQEGKHSKGTGTYYRPPGGGIEHGEKSTEALIREFQEELQADIVNPRFLGVLENIFTVDESIGHEIALIYSVDFANTALYHQEKLQLNDDGVVQHDAVWVPLEELRNGQVVLFPNGLVELLEHNPFRSVEKFQFDTRLNYSGNMKSLVQAKYDTNR